MLNTEQNNEIEHINKEINLLEDRPKKNEKSQSHFQNGLMQIKRIWIKKGRRTNLYQTKIIQNIVKKIFQNKIDQIKNNTNLLQNILKQVKNERDYLKNDWRK